MKLLLFGLFLAVAAQDRTNSAAESSIISGITDQLLKGFTHLLDSAFNDVATLSDSLNSNVNKSVSDVPRTVSNLVDELLFSVKGLLAEARDSGKSVDGCANRTKDLELVKPNTSIEAEKCRSNLDKERASISAELKKERDRGTAVISTLAKSLQNCIRGFSIPCITIAQQSALRDIQVILKNTRILGQRTSLASEELTKCLNGAEENALRLANEIYQEIQKCISEAPQTVPKLLLL